jgi:hypothetical protein
MHRLYTLPRTAYRIYRDYAKQLWADTNTSARQKIADDKTRQAIRDVQHILQNRYEFADDNNNSEESSHSDKARKDLLAACDQMLLTLPHEEEADIVIDEKIPVDGNGILVESITDISITDSNSNTSAATAAMTTTNSTTTVSNKKKPRRSIMFGAIMGAAVAMWVFSGNYIFTGLFCLMTILGQLEYYRMVMNTGVFPARRISVIGATSMFLTVRLQT